MSQDFVPKGKRGVILPRIFKRVAHDLFKLTTADENVGTDLRAATILNEEVAAQERCSHLEARIFIRAIHATVRDPQA